MGSLKRLTPLLVMLGLVVAACTSASPSPGGSAGGSGGGGSLSGQSVRVLGTWTDVERLSFMAMVKPWEDLTGATVNYQGTRAINDILAAGLASNVLPDLAGLPGLGQMKEYVTAGALQPLDGVLDTATYASENSPGLAKLGQDSIVGHEIGDEIRSSTFSVSETLNQVANVAGGLAGVLVSMLDNGQAGLAIAAGAMVVALVLLVVRRRQRVRARGLSPQP